jgi:tetratricopeptide (TPR) repeat protein/transglutaminase-like putative cysteine protease
LSSHSSHRYFVVLSIFACLFSAMHVGVAQQAVEPWKAPHFSVDPKAMYEAASSVAVPDSANIVIYTDDESYSFDDAGRMDHVVHYVYKILTQKGAEGLDHLAVGWEPWHEAKPVIRVRVITPDFVEHPLDQKAVTEAPARGGDYKLYSDGKQVRAPFPAIAPGVVVEAEYVEHETEPFFASGRVGRVSFGQEGVAVEHSRAEFEAPASLPLHTETILLPEVKPTRTEAGGKVTLTFEVGRLESIDSTDSNLPPDVERYPAIGFSTGKSWQAVSAEYSKIVDSYTGPAAVQAIVDKVTEGKKTIQEKEEAILEYLDREVRYTGIEFGEAAIVPHEPAETLTHKYGDCKDKATLLVAMLRAAGIPADVALLNAGSRLDVTASLAGMGMFDHAIVYVPADVAHKLPDLWIDATATYARLGQLPGPDQGRFALIASGGTTALKKTPESSSKDNVVLELRELKLSDNGPATVTEKTQPTGVFESMYRSYYADEPDKDTREGLTGYIKAQYVAEKLGSVDRSNPADLSQQFELTLVGEKAKRGYTELDSALAAIRLEGLFNQLPNELRRKDDSEEEKKKQEQSKDAPKAPRTADWELPQAFISDWRYRIVPPEGFVAKELPKDEKIFVGPALLTEDFSADKDGVVLARLTFDSVKRRYTVAEATELRNKVAELEGGSAIVVNFEPLGQALLHQGKVRDALAAYRSLIALHPDKAVHHLQLASVLLEAGMGESARAEARLAVKLDPSSALAEKTLAEILKHDLVGRNLRGGSDYSGAVEAYRAAVKLDPDDHLAQGNLAILLEYDAVGRRYGGRAKMKDAIVEYQSLGQDKLTDLGIAGNLAFAEFYGGSPEEALKAAQTLNPEPAALIGASEAMLHGSKAGQAEVNKRSSGDTAFKGASKTAGEMLMNIREYPLAADFLEAGASGDNAAQTMGLASMLRGAGHHEDLKFANTPADLVKHAFLLTMDPDLSETKMDAICSRNAVAVMKAEDPEERKKDLEAGKKLNSQMARQDESLDVTVDMFMQAFDPKADGNDTTGYREKVQIPGGNTLTAFVVKENGEYKLLDTNDKPNAIALEMLDRIKSGDLAGAKVLLDWMREDQHLEGGDDPLGGPVFPRFWTKGQAADARKMRLAAGAVMVGTKATVAQGVAVLEEAQKDAVSDREKTNILLALALGYAVEDNYLKLLEVSSTLLKQEPESKLAFMENVQALLGLARYEDAMAQADERLKLLDNDADALRMKMEIESARGNYDAARAIGRKMVDQGKQDAEVFNEIAWFALFTGKVDDADIAAAIKATQLANDNPHILHTLACLYAETGKPKEARDLLLRSMDDLNLDAPDDDYWYAFGRIAEQYGERDIAIADYRKLEKPKQNLALATSSYRLAQTRLKALGGADGNRAAAQ